MHIENIDNTYYDFLTTFLKPTAYHFENYNQKSKTLFEYFFV